MMSMMVGRNICRIAIFSEGALFECLKDAISRRYADTYYLDLESKLTASTIVVDHHREYLVSRNIAWKQCIPDAREKVHFKR